MKIALLDGNIYNFLVDDNSSCAIIRACIEKGVLEIIVSRTVEEELIASPFQGVPELFPVRYIGNSAPLCGLMKMGDSLGDARMFYAHLGNSRQENDALIADAADWDADWLVSEDVRLRKRLTKFARRCVALSADEFLLKLKDIGAGSECESRFARLI